MSKIGCDIHMNVEMQAAGGVWTRAEDLEPSPYFDKEAAFPYNEQYTYEDWYGGRNYDDFSKLAGVRGGIRPIIEPRGLPDDISEYTRKCYERWEGDAHTPHYYTLAEILPYQTMFGDGTYTSEVKTIIDRMRDLAAEELEGNHDRIRMVFWFDN